MIIISKWLLDPLKVYITVNWDCWNFKVYSYDSNFLIKEEQWEESRF